MIGMKSTKAQIQLRVEDLLGFQLEGAQFWHIREYVREREKQPGSIWYRGEGQNPISDATLWRYLSKTEQLISESFISSREKLIRWHIAKRNDLYAKAVARGDLRTALAILDSLAKLQKLIPAEETFPNGHTTVNIFERVAILTQQLRADQQSAPVVARIQTSTLPDDDCREQVCSTTADSEAATIPPAS
jgi:hypothetical protein